MGLLRRHPRDRAVGHPAPAGDERRLGLMEDATEIDAVYRLLDAEVRDVDHRRVGRVDDLMLSGEPGSPARLTGFLSGSGAWHSRLPRRLRGLGARLFGPGTIGKD